MSTYNIGFFYEEMAKNIFHLSSNIIKCAPYLFLCVYLKTQISLGHQSELNEPRCEKTGLWGFRLGLTQTRLYSYRRWPEA